jgi:hypothetical protein
MKNKLFPNLLKENFHIPIERKSLVKLSYLSTKCGKTSDSGEYCPTLPALQGEIQ